MISYPDLSLDENLDRRLPSDYKSGYSYQSEIEDYHIIRPAIQDSSVGTTQLENLAVTTAKINDLAVTNAKINTLSADKLTAGTIDASVISVTNINADNIDTGTLTGRIVQTASSGARIVLHNNNLLQLYDANYLQITLDGADGKLHFYYLGNHQANLYGALNGYIKTDNSFIASGNITAAGDLSGNTLQLTTLTSDPTAPDGTMYYREDGVNYDFRVKVNGTWRSVQLV